MSETTAQLRQAEIVPQQTAPAVPKLYYNEEETAALLNISKRTLQYWMKAKVISYFKRGKIVLFQLADIERAVQRFTVRAVGERG